MDELNRWIRQRGGAASVGKRVYEALGESRPQQPRSVNDRVSDLLRRKRMNWWNGDGKNQAIRRSALAKALGVDEAEVNDRIKRAVESLAEPGVFRFHHPRELGRLDLTQGALPPFLPADLRYPGRMMPNETRVWEVPSGKDDWVRLVGEYLDHVHGWRVINADEFEPNQARHAQGIFMVIEGSDDDGLVERIAAARRSKAICPILVARCCAKDGEWWPVPEEPSPTEFGSQQTTLGDLAGKNEKQILDLKEGESALLRIAAANAIEGHEDDLRSMVLPNKAHPFLWIPFREHSLRLGYPVELPRITSWLEDADRWLVDRGVDLPEDGKRQGAHGFASATDYYEYLEDRLNLGSTDWRKRLDDWLESQPDARNMDPAIDAELLGALSLWRLINGLPVELAESKWTAFLKEILPSAEKDDGLYSRSRVLFSQLGRLGILVRGSSNRWRIVSGWVHDATVQLAIERAFQRVHAKWLAALCYYPETSKRVVRQIVESTEEGWAVVEACLAIDSTKIEHGAAVDAGFRALGLAVMQGMRPPKTLLQTAWNRQMDQVIRRWENWPKIPAVRVWDLRQTTGLSTIGAWFAAALSISRALTCEHDQALEQGGLNPWQSDGNSDDLEQAICQIDSAFLDRGGRHGTARTDPHAQASYALGEQLLAHGIKGTTVKLSIQGPGLLVQAFRDKDAEAAKPFKSLGFGLATLRASCDRQDVDFLELLNWCWAQLWSQPNTLPITAVEAAGSQNQRAFWSTMVWSDHVLEHIRDRPLVWASLDEAAWLDWVNRVREPNKLGGFFRDHPQVFDEVPERGVFEAIKTFSVSPWCHGVRSRLWERRPEQMQGWIDELAKSDEVVPVHEVGTGVGTPLSGLIHSAPNDQALWCVERAQKWCEAPKMDYPGVWKVWNEPPRWLWFFLWKVFDDRTEGAKEAFELTQHERVRALE